MTALLVGRPVALGTVTSMLETATPAAFPETEAQRLALVAVMNFRATHQMTDGTHPWLSLMGDVRAVVRSPVLPVEQMFECSTKCSTYLVNMARTRQERLHQAQSLPQTMRIPSTRWLELTVSS